METSGLRGLMIIDVQPNYADSAGNVLLHERIIEKIELYKKHDLPIVIVEYRCNYEGTDQCYHTYPDIIQAIGNYRRQYTVVKNEDNGSFAIKSTLLQRKLVHVNLWELVDVNLQYCVGKTACGLGKLFPNKEFIIPESATHSPHTQESSRNAIDKLIDERSIHSNVRFIRTNRETPWDYENSNDDPRVAFVCTSCDNEAYV